MPRSFEKTIYPADQKGKTVETYTYAPAPGSSIHGIVWLELESVGSRSYARMSPAEARHMGQALLEAAAQAEADHAAARNTAKAQQPEQVPA